MLPSIEDTLDLDMLRAHPERDRDALLLRFFEGRSLAEVGAAINLTENSARMRVERALEKLHARLKKRGITSTAAALGVALANQPVLHVADPIDVLQRSLIRALTLGLILSACSR